MLLLHAGCAILFSTRWRAKGAKLFVKMLVNFSSCGVVCSMMLGELTSFFFFRELGLCLLNCERLFRCD